SPAAVAREDVNSRHDPQTHKPKSKKTQITVLNNKSKENIEDKYALDRELGRGEFGVTYLCIDKTSRELLACKSISKRKLRTAVDVDDVRREVEIMKHLPDDGSIVTLREACEDENAVHLVMELCEGGELFDRIVARGHYTERAAAGVVRTIVEIVSMYCVRFSAESIYLITVEEHPWIQNAKKAPNVPLGDVVKSRLKQFSLMNRFKRKALRVIADFLSNEEVEDIKEMFKKIDTDDDGVVTVEELKIGLQKLNSQLAESEIQSFVEAVDTNGKGTLDYGEFVAVSLHLRKMANDEHLHKAFSYFDKDGDGYIMPNELRDTLMEDGDDLSADIANDIFQEVDTDKVMPNLLSYNNIHNSILQLFSKFKEGQIKG
ncbi:hypothetical protein M8C21_002902, partial [Ambrosia artemisiifolia]